eukprot:263011_1
MPNDHVQQYLECKNKVGAMATKIAQILNENMVYKQRPEAVTDKALRTILAPHYPSIVNHVWLQAISHIAQFEQQSRPPIDNTNHNTLIHSNGNNQQHHNSDSNNDAPKSIQSIFADLQDDTQVT